MHTNPNGERRELHWLWQEEAELPTVRQDLRSFITGVWEVLAFLAVGIWRYEQAGDILQRWRRLLESAGRGLGSRLPESPLSVGSDKRSTTRQRVATRSLPVCDVSWHPAIHFRR